MSKEANTPPQISLILRLFGGGYLMYLAWDLRSSVHDSLFFLIAVIVFAVVGLVLFAATLRTLITHRYFRKDPAPEIETNEDCEEQSDD